MPRYPHFIKPGSPGKWPDLVVSVDCRTAVESVDGTEERQIERLVSWHAELVAMDSGSYRALGCVAADTTQAWWEEIDSLASEYHNVWIISYQCGRIWSLLDFWDQLEVGYVSILPRSQTRQDRFDFRLRRMRKKAGNPLGALSAGALSRLLSADAGALVCADPPSIATFTLGDRGSKICWVDWRNYGCEPDREIQVGAGTAAEMSRWWVDYTRAIREYALGFPKTTSGSQAFNGWRFGYYTGGVHVHTDRSALALESGSYHGGRCECFRVGAIQGTVYHVDVRSMYPAICVREALPARLVRVSSGDSCVQESGGSKGQGRIAEVTITSDEPAYPRVRDDITIWPVGRFRTTLAGPELEDAERLGRVVAYHSVAYYELLPCLKECAEAIYDLRVQSEFEGRKSLCQTAKKLLVSLPGKFAQRLRVWQTIPFTSAHPLWGEWWGTNSQGKPTRYRSLGGPVQEDRDLGFGGETVPSIATWITSAGRVFLLEAIRLAGWSECYYCDTDSLLVSEVGYQRLSESGCVANRALGKWQLKEVLHDAAVYGIKHYLGNGELVCSGLPGGSTCRSADPTRYWYTDSPAWQVQARHKPTATRRLLAYKRAQEYRHGKVGEDGRVTPFRLEEV